MGHALFDLTGKTAVVVGGTSGIGLAMAVGLAEAGADVVASSRRQEQVDEAAALIESRGRKTLRLTSDVGQRATLQALLDETIKAWGKVDILINCAGKIKRAPTVDFPEDVWDDIMDTNVNGTLRACQIFGKHMLERGYGRIINIASLNTFVSLKEVTAYACSQGRGGRADQVAGGGVELAGSYGECDRAGRLPHRAERRSCWTRASAAKNCACARPWAVSERRKSWSARRCSSHRTQPHSSPARFWWWTAGSLPAA